MIAFLIALVVSVVSVGLLRTLAVRRGLIDVPNERSSHAVPTPRGGGLGLLLGVGAALIGWPLTTASGAVAVTAFVGWLDDHRGMPVRLRLAAHIASALLVLPLAHALPLPAWLAPLGAAWWVFWVVSAINVVNFMDGIDGMIGLQAMLFSAYVAASASAGGAAQVVALATAAASAGFLCWNWPPARIFLGDVGSGALGVVFVIEGALLLREGRVSFAAAYLPLAPLFLDAMVTLVQRARRNERLSVAHRSHLYQRLANGGLGHARVSVAYAAATVAVASVAYLRPTAGLGTTFGVLIGLAVVGVTSARYFLRTPASAYHS